MANSSPRIPKWISSRLWVQTAFLLVWLDPLALRLHQFCAPAFHCYACPLSTFACPIGVLANFSALHVFPFAVWGVLLIAGILFGGFICGWACPFGLLQDLAAKTPAPKLKLPSWTGYLRYLVLIGMVFLIPWFFGETHPLFFCRACPAGGLEAAAPDIISQALSNNPISWPNPVKIVVTLLFVVGIFFIHRPWCHLFCPLGAIFGLFNRIAVLSLKLNAETCTQCGMCRKRCDMNLSPDLHPNHTSCIRCLECTACPTSSLKPASIIRKLVNN